MEELNFGTEEYSPAANAASVTPNDSANLSNYSRALYIGSDGNVKVDMALDGTAITFTSLNAGTILPIRVKKVYSTDTTATGIVNLY